MELRNSADADVVSSATGMLRLELVVHQCLMEMGRQVVQDLAQQAGTGYQGRRVKRGKVVFRFKGNRAKTVHGLYGPVTVDAPTTTPAVAERRGCRWMSSWGSETGSAPMGRYCGCDGHRSRSWSIARFTGRCGYRLPRRREEGNDCSDKRKCQITVQKQFTSENAQLGIGERRLGPRAASGRRGMTWPWQSRRP